MAQGSRNPLPSPTLGDPVRIAGLDAEVVLALRDIMKNLNVRGVWDALTLYAGNDVVSYGGSSYVAVDASTGVVPGTDPDFWMVLASKGDAGDDGDPGLQGDPGVGLSPWEVKDANFSAAAEGRYQVDTSGGAVTCTLPASAVAGDEVFIEDATLSWAVNNLTLDRNGLKVNGATSDYTADVAGGKLSLVYISAGYGWSVK